MRLGGVPLRSSHTVFPVVPVDPSSPEFHRLKSSSLVYLSSGP